MSEDAKPPLQPVEVETALHTAGQRRVNLLWEYTQAGIAGLVTTTVLLCTGYLVIAGVETMKTAAFGFLVGIANLVIGFYFGRTNHQRTGGIGANEIGR